MKAAAALDRRADDAFSLKALMLLPGWMPGFVLAFQAGIFIRLFM